ncbi:hypothetical protein CPZ06_10440, partial [Lactobacillus acidophilus]
TCTVPLGNALGDILDAFNRTHRGATVFVNDESHLGKIRRRRSGAKAFENTAICIDRQAIRR